MTKQAKLFCGITLLLLYIATCKGIFALLKILLLFASGYIGYRIACVRFEDKNLQLPKRLNRNQYSVTNSIYSEDLEYIFDTSPEISNELREIVGLIIRDYVMVWFERIDQTPDSKFPKELDKVLLKAIDNATRKLKHCDTVTLILSKIIPLITLHFNSFIKAKRHVIERLVSKNHSKLSISESSLIEEYKKYKILHHAVNEDPDNLEKGVEIHLRKIVKRLLPYLVPSQELESSFVSILIREILTTNIFAPLIMKYSDPDNWNLAFVNLSKRVLRERNQIHKVRRILVKEIKKPRTINDYEDVSKIDNCVIESGLNENTSSKEFELFLRQINLLNSYSDLRSTKLSLTIKLQRLKNKGSTIDAPEKMSKAEETLKKRILISLNMLDTKLKYIEPNMSIPSYMEFDKSFLNEVEDFISDITLDSIFLNDKLCVSSFRQYLKMNNYKDAIVYLDFWILVDSLKSQLEGLDSQDIVVRSSTNDLKFLLNIREKFLSNNNLETMLVLDKGLVENIQLVIEDEELQKTEAFLLAKKSLFLLQGQALKVLSEKYFTSFKESNMILKMIASPEFTSTQEYSMYFSSKHESPIQKVESNKGVNYASNTVMMFSNPNLNEELEEIINGSDNFDIKNTDPIEGFSENGKKNSFLSTNKIPCDMTTVILGRCDDNNNNIERNNKSHQINDESLNQSTESMGSKYISDTMNDRCYDFFTLRNEMSQLGIAIEETKKELDLLKHLILKADLMDNKEQLKLLKKSQRALFRDLEKKELLMQQLSIQENANSLYKNTIIHINYYYGNSQISSIREVIFYVINVDHVYKGQATSWEMPRRYSEFYTLHKYLKRRYSLILSQESIGKLFPPKENIKWGRPSPTKEFRENRRHRFELYLNKLLEYPEICQDDVFRRFLTDSFGFYVQASKNPTELFGNCISDKSSLPNIGSRINHLEYTSLSETSSQVSDTNSNITDESLLVDASCSGDTAQGKENDNGKVKSIQQEVDSNVSFLKPVCDLFISLFSLNKSNTLWLRGGAIILVLQQLLGGTIEKYIKDSIIRLQSPENVHEYLVSIKQSLWGEDGLIERRRKMTEKTERTITEKKKTRKDSRLLLRMLFTEVCGKVVGHRHSQDAALKIHDLVQIRCLNASLLLEIVDIILDDIFFTEN